MTSNFYIIDTSSLIHLNRHNPKDIYPGVWKKLGGLVKSGRLIAPKEVYNEIKQIDDSLLEWVEAHNKIFVEPTVRQITIVREILDKYPAAIKVDRTYDADPWVIALAIEFGTDPQSKLIQIKQIIVTEEKLRGNRIKIPYICKKFNIETIDILDLLRIEGWKF